jgi:two-component system NarL family response regulator
MMRPAPEPSPLVYIQDDTFVAAVGEPLPLAVGSRIVVAKWDGLYAEALRSACARAFPGAAVTICRRGDETLQALRAAPADLVLTGLTFVDMDGVDVLERIARERLAVRVLVVSSRRDEHSMQTLRAARFDGFFDPFAEDLEALVEALRQVADGRGYISASLRRQLTGRSTAEVLGQRLTPGELQVFCVIGDGSDDMEAAERLGLTVSTVQTHRRNIMRKLGVPTSAKLVREAVRLGVVRITTAGTIIRPGFEQKQADWQSRKTVGKTAADAVPKPYPTRPRRPKGE